MRCYLISQSCFFLGSSYGGNFAYVCSTCFLYLSLNIWCTVKKKQKGRKKDVFKYLRCVDTGRTLYSLEWRRNPEPCCWLYYCTFISAPPPCFEPLDTLWLSHPSWFGLFSWFVLGFFFSCFLFCFVFCLSAVLGKCYCVVLDQRSFHIPIHILYWFINRHFYKNNEEFLS